MIEAKSYVVNIKQGLEISIPSLFEEVQYGPIWTNVSLLCTTKQIVEEPLDMRMRILVGVGQILRVGKLAKTTCTVQFFYVLSVVMIKKMKRSD